jgi:hypothetical protein
MTLSLRSRSLQFNLSDMIFAPKLLSLEDKSQQAINNIVCYGPGKDDGLFMTPKFPRDVFS